MQNSSHHLCMSGRLSSCCASPGTAGRRSSRYCTVSLQRQQCQAGLAARIVRRQFSLACLLRLAGLAVSCWVCDSVWSQACCVQALCTEASLHALRRQYPQIYDSNDKLLVDPATVRVSRTDFFSAFKAITPSSHRSAVAHAR